MRKVSLGAWDISSLASDVLNRGGWISFTVHGTSMLPTLRDGDLVRVAPCDPQSVIPGDVIMYRSVGGGAAIHRVAAAEGGFLAVKGDSRPRDSIDIGYCDVLGRIEYAKRNGRQVNLGLTAVRRGFIGLRYTALRFSGVMRKSAGHVLRVLTAPAFVRRSLRRVVGPRVRCGPAEDGDEGRQARGSCTWRTFQAVLGSRVVGSVQLVSYAEGTPFSGCRWIFGLAVNTLLRGCGIGRALVETVIRESVSEGDPDLHLVVERDNHRALELYRSLGFETRDLDESGEALRERIRPGCLVMVLETADAGSHLAEGDLPL